MSQQIDFATRVAQKVRLRDKIKEIKDRHKEELAPYLDADEKLDAMLLAHLNEVNTDSANTAAGTVYRTRKDSASIADMQAFWCWVVAQDQFDMVDKKANHVAVREYLEELQEKQKEDPTVVVEPPPGVNFTSMYTVGVRRASGKKDKAA